MIEQFNAKRAAFFPDVLNSNDQNFREYLKSTFLKQETTNLTNLPFWHLALSVVFPGLEDGIKNSKNIKHFHKSS